MKFFLFISVFCSVAFSKPSLTVGSKPFTENYILGELVAQVIEQTGEANADRRLGLGDTGIIFEALRTGSIDFYVEYTGTISETIVNNPDLKTTTEIRNALKKYKLTITEPLGFNNTYGIAIPKKLSERLSLKRISDLKDHPQLVAGFDPAFMDRKDCYPNLQKVYNVRFDNIHRFSHGLIYEAISNQKIDFIDVYTTDAKIDKFQLIVLEDDKKAFPTYHAVILARTDVLKKFPKTWAALKKLEGKIHEKTMISMNAQAELQGKSFADVAREFLSGEEATSQSNFWKQLWKLTLQHLMLVGIALFSAILIGVPLGIIATRYKHTGHFILASSGLIQTIPALALLCFFIPLFGIGTLPALVALTLYALLPIVRNTYVGLIDIDPKLIEVAKAIGLAPGKRLRLIELPLATRTLLAGVKTSAVITVGTATLAALIGAGGYGDPIITGLALNDMGIILEGAIPAAVMALCVHGLFEFLDRFFIPEGLKKE